MIPDLKFRCTQAEFNYWFSANMKRVETDSSFMRSDLNDGVMIFLTARQLVIAHPEKLQLAETHTPECVKSAMNDLGMFMGVTNLANKLELDPQEAITTMMALIPR